MFLVYYVLVALITFWAVSTHPSTRGKLFVAIASALVMPIGLPFVLAFYLMVGIASFVSTKPKS